MRKKGEKEEREKKERERKRETSRIRHSFLQQEEEKENVLNS